MTDTDIDNLVAGVRDDTSAVLSQLEDPQHRASLATALVLAGRDIVAMPDTTALGRRFAEAQILGAIEYTKE